MLLLIPFSNGNWSFLCIWLSFFNYIFSSSITIPAHHLQKRHKSHPERDILHARRDAALDEPMENWQVQQPPSVPNGRSCSHTLLTYNFAKSYGTNATVPYNPPADCGPPGTWAAVIFKLTFTSQGNQYDRLASVFLGGTEIWRTSTSEPLPQGIFWSVTRDMTKYMPLLTAASTNLAVRLENLIDPNLGLDGTFEVKLSATYHPPTPRFRRPSTPHMIIPFEGGRHDGDDGATSLIQIPAYTSSAYLEMFATGSSDEEFWFANVDDKAKELIDPQKTAGITGKGCFREVQLWIDGSLAGVAFPFPVIYTGGLVLTLWRPMASFGAFDTPTYVIDITPWLPLLTDDKYHNFTIAVEGQGIGKTINKDWVISGNIAVTLDPSGKRTTGKIISYDTVPLKNSNPKIIEGNQVQIDTTGKRTLSISSIIQTGSSPPQVVKFEQELNFQNTQIWGNGGATEAISQKTWGSSIATYGQQVRFLDQYQWPISVQLRSSQQGIDGAVKLTYQRKFLEPLSLLMTETEHSQSAEGTLNKVNGQITGGPAQHTANFFFRNSRNQDYSRKVGVANNTIFYDKIIGNMA